MTIDKTIVIIGPTASGKTSLSIKLAEKHGGEIISADSRAIYKYMDIGTAKPTIEEQNRVKHWGIDLVDPDVKFTVHDFQQYALDKIYNIKSRGKIPFLVGGSGLYIDSVVYDYEFNSTNSQFDRKKLADKSVSELQQLCTEQGIELPENSQNKRYLIRALETNGVVKNNRTQINPEFIIIGIATDKEILKNRIVERAHEMFAGNIVKETTFLAERYDWNSEPMKSNIYRVVKKHISGETTLEQAIDEFIQLDLRLAKRQITWFKRNPQITWLNLDDAYRHIDSLLSEQISDTIPIHHE